MGPDEIARHDAEADAFFAYFNNPSIDLIAALWGERGGSLERVVAEDKAFGYWGRKMAQRAERAALKALEATRREQALQERLSTVPTAPVPPEGQPAVLLPMPRLAALTEEEREETRRWWHRLAMNRGAYTLRNRIRREIRDAAADDTFQARANAAWRLEQRAFERAQWRDVLRMQEDRKRRRVANRWLAISEDRALAIALAALDQQHPPQGRK